MLVASIIGTLAFFVPWGVSGAGATLVQRPRFGLPDGITLAELQPTRGWGPPSANLMFGLVLLALVLSVAMNLGVHATGVAAVIAVAGGGLAVFCLDWIWLGRHRMDIVTGLWVVAASGIALFAFALLYVLRRGDGTA
jgi:hypothetical protein